jgi:hypothetical protein
VLVLDGDPLSEAEVDDVAAIVARAEPQDALPHLRRIALTNVLFQRMAARRIEPGLRGEALQHARGWRAAAAAGAEAVAAGEPAQRITLEGGLPDLGLELWGWALDAEIGRWSDPIEVPGAWHVARVLERSRGLTPTDVRLRVERCTFPWLAAADAARAVDARLDRARLEFVDETWRDVVPTWWQRRLRGSP